jgi:hypothetical protein
MKDIKSEGRCMDANRDEIAKLNQQPVGVTKQPVGVAKQQVGLSDENADSSFCHSKCRGKFFQLA